MSLKRWSCLGMDVAPCKLTAIWRDDAAAEMRPPSELRAYVTRAIEQHTRLLITWDAPLSFSVDDFYNRPIDKATRRWCKSLETNRIEKHSRTSRIGL